MEYNNIVYTDIPRTVSADICERLRKLGVATVHEAMGKLNLADSEIRPVCAGLSCAGPAVTCHCPAGDNLMPHKALTLVKPGDVLVIYAQAFTRAGLWGELTSLTAKVAGVAGVVIDGGVRDTAQIREMQLPLWSRSVHAGGTDKNGAGAVNVPIVFGGTMVAPGDIVIADDDGICVVPRLRAEEICLLAEKREASEEVSKQNILAGKTLFETYNMSAAFDKLNIIIKEGAYTDGIGD